MSYNENDYFFATNSRDMLEMMLVYSSLLEQGRQMNNEEEEEVYDGEQEEEYLYDDQVEYMVTGRREYVRNEQFIDTFDEINRLYTRPIIFYNLLNTVPDMTSDLLTQTLYTDNMIERDATVSDLTLPVMAYSSISDVGSSCYVCLEDFTPTDTVTIIDCGHIFHYDCINEWHKHKNACTICKNPITLS